MVEIKTKHMAMLKVFAISVKAQICKMSSTI